jgi:co-chaperonin GroES (HSP10)
MFPKRLSQKARNQKRRKRGKRKMTNTSGIQPVELKVLVYPDPIDEKVGSIYMPETVRDKESRAQVEATLIAVGGHAFDDWKKPIPKPGERVYMGKYAGIKDITGVDGKVYNLIRDNDILAIITEE